MSQTAEQPGIAISQIRNVPIPIPPFSEQISIVNHIEKETAKLDLAIATIKKEITLVQEYKTALIAETVTGKIDVWEYEMPNIEKEAEACEEIAEDSASDVEEMVAEDGEENQINGLEWAIKKCHILKLP